MTAIGRDWSKFAPSSVTAVGAPMDLRKLKTLNDLVSESNVSELEITEAEGKVRIVKSDAPMLSQHTPAPIPAPPPPPPPPPRRRGAGGGEPPPPAGGWGPRRPYRQVAHGGHVLPIVEPRRQGLCRSGQPGQGGRDHLHHRGHENP